MSEPFYNYSVKIEGPRFEDSYGWRWQVDAEPRNGVLGFGSARTRRSAVRKARRCMASHARRRKNKPDYWWERPTSREEEEK